jgi:hypothetical protein
VPAAADVTATDACDAAPAVSLAENTLAGDCLDDYTLTRVWTATDACGNSSDAQQVITVSDTTAPILNCPADATALACGADTSPTATGEAAASDNCGEAAVGFADVSNAGCGSTVSVARTWSATDDCGNADSCVQAIATVDNTPPVVTVDTTPIEVIDLDCSGDEVVTLPVATAADDCGAATLTDNAPAIFTAGATTTVTYTAVDECGNTAAETLDVTVLDGAALGVDVQRFVVGAGNHPDAGQHPIVGVQVCAYDREQGSCAQALCGNNAHQCVVDNCTPVTCATTDANGAAMLFVPPGAYSVIAADAGTSGILPEPLGQIAGAVDCEDTQVVRLRQIENANGRKQSAKITRLTGSELLILEPEEVLWDDTEQLYPFVFESVGDWQVTVAVTPPDGFVADHDELSETVTNEHKAVQFTITEVGSDLVPTQTVFHVTHNGQKRVVRSEIGISLTAEYARSRGFSVPELRKQGLIKEPQPAAALEQAEGVRRPRE